LTCLSEAEPLAEGRDTEWIVEWVWRLQEHRLAEGSQN